MNGKKVNNHEQSKDEGFSTKAVHAGQDPSQWRSYTVIPPISLGTTFQQLVPGKPVEYDYSRSGNPTRKCLEECIATLENGKFAMCFSSGLAATNSLSYLLKAGDHIVCGDDVYGGTNRYFRTCLAKMGVEISFVDATNIENVKKSTKANTKMFWMETPTNPTMKLCDIKLVAEFSKTIPEALLVVDNTFMSSYFQRPLALGADIVIHSLTKYMNGHSDVVMGAIITNREDVNSRMRYLQNSIGSVPSAFDCFLVNRGLKTLALRMEQHQLNGLEIGKHLESHPMVRKVLHPGLPSHPQHELALKQCSGFSGMISFYLKGGGKEAEKFVTSTKVFRLAESLGGIESLCEIPAVMTHASVPIDLRKDLGIDDGLIRLSCGIENTKDLIADVEQALEKCKNL